MTKRLRLGAAVLLMSCMFGLAPTVSGEPAMVIHKVDEAHLSAVPTGPIFMLAVGSDTRAGLDGSRGDALHVIGVNPAVGRATILNIPRDTFVEIPGRGRSKINDGLAAGGPQLQGETVGALVGVPVTFVVTTTFEGLISMVDAFGGVDVNVPIPMNDSLSGAVFPAGPMHMDGHQALAFSRNRHIPDGDIARSTNQATLLLAALSRLRADTSIAGTLRALAVLVRYARVDGLGLRDVYRLGRLGLSLDPANVRSVTMPSSVGTIGDASVVFPGPGAAELFADFADNAILDSH